MQNRSCEKRAWGLARLTMMVVAVLLSAHGWAQMSTTTVQGTVYRADGTPAGGTLLIHWPAFTTAQNQAVAAGSLNAAIGADGFISVNLTPNAGALPAGSYYTATYHLNDGTVNEEYWVVPASGTATVGAVRAQLQPVMTAVAPAVTPDYVQSALAGLSGSYLPLTGGTMSGTLTLSGDPAASTQATTKHYVDQLAAQNLPLSGGTLTGPLTAPSISAKQLEGRFYADQNGTSSNGIAMSVSQCLSLPYACHVVAPALYAATERPTLSSFTPPTMYYEDDRNGTQTEYFHNPGGPLLNYPYGVPQTGRAKAIYAGFDGYTITAHGVENIAYYDATPGLNLAYPGYTGSQGWAGGNVIDAQQTTWGMGIQEMITAAMNAYGEGDHALQYNYNFSRDMAVTVQDEGASAFSSHMDEPSNEFTGTCASGCTTGTTRLKVASPTQGAGTQGVGQYAILDGTQTACSVTTIGAGLSPAMAAYTVSGCTITPSTGWGMLNAPGINFTVNLNPPFTVSNTFVLTLAGGSGPTTATQICAVDKRDCFYPTSVSVAGSQITVTAPLRIEHLSGTYFFWGGVTGDVLDFPAFDAAGNKYVSQVAGAINATTLEVFFMRAGTAAPPDLPQSWQPGTSNSVSSSGTTVSFTPQTGLPNYGWPGVNIVISGCSDSALNTACTNVTWPNSSVGNCTIAGLSGTHSCSGSITTSMTGTAGIATNTVYLYNAAQVTDVQNTTTGTTVQGSTNVTVASTATISTGELVGGPGIASGTTVASASGTTLVLSTPAVANGTGVTLLFQNPGSGSMLPDGTISLEQNNLAVTTSSTVELASPISARYQGTVTETTNNNPYTQSSSVIAATWQGHGATNTDSGNAMYYAGNGNSDSMYQGLGGIYTAPIVFLEQGPYSAGIKFLEAPALGGNFLYILPNGAQTGNPLYSFNLWDLQNYNGQTFSANYNPYYNTFTFGCTASGCQYRFPTPATTANDTEPATTAFVKSVACQANGTNCPAPSGTAGGDLSGSYPNPTVAKINGATVTRGTATLVSGTVTVSNAAACAVGATCVYKFTHCGTNSSTAIGTLSLGTVTAGTSFVVNSLTATNTVATGDASTVCWQIN